MIARSIRGAVKTYLRLHRELRPGDFVAVKLRGAGADWEHYKVTK